MYADVHPRMRMKVLGLVCVNIHRTLIWIDRWSQQTLWLGLTILNLRNKQSVSRSFHLLPEMYEWFCEPIWERAKKYFIPPVS